MSNKMYMNPQPSYKDLEETFGRDEIRKICLEKIREYREPSPPRFTQLQKEYLKFRIGNQANDSIEFGQYIKNQNRIQKLAYWSRLYLKVTDVSKTTQGPELSPEKIQRAREFPTHQLYEGKLIRSGRTYKARCPFHEERTPSFYFYDDGAYHCFGCSAHGSNAVDYVIATEKLKFPDAVRRLV